MRRTVFVVLSQFVFLLGLLSLSYSSTSSPYPLNVKSYKGISYLSGGFGVEEREALHSMSKGDNLKLTFALDNKDFLGGAKVVIKDNKGETVLQANSDGPWFFTKLPEGRYTILATAMGKTLSRVAHVSARGQTQLHFAWAESTQRMASHKTAPPALAKK